MNGKHRAPATAEDTRTSGLSRLVETEDSLEMRVREARDEAARTIERARAAVRVAHEQLEQDLAPAVQQLLAAIAAGVQSEIQELEAARTEQTAAYHAMAGERLDAVARAVVARVIGGPSTTAGTLP